MEEGTTTTDKGLGDAGSSEGESGADGTSNNLPVKKGRGRPKGSKKLQVWVTQVNLTNVESNSLPITCGKDGVGTDGSTPKRKRGRPKGSPNKKTLMHLANQSLSNGGPSPPKKGRGSVSLTRTVESGEREDVTTTPSRKRGRPKGSLNKRPRLVESRGVNSEVEQETISNGNQNTPKRISGRPRKHRASEEETGSAGKQEGDLTDVQGQPVLDGLPTPKRGRGRPKGSFAKKPPSFKVHGKVGRPRKDLAPPSTTVAVKKRGRTKKEPLKRGRPRKYPLPSPEELKKPKVWKPLGRPRKYPRVDPPEGTAPLPRRSRGRPRKSKKGAHLRKVKPSTLSASPDSDGHKKKGRPLPTKADGTPHKPRGRPKGSGKKDRAVRESQPSLTTPSTRRRQPLEGKALTDEATSQNEVRDADGEKGEDAGESEGRENRGFPPLDENEIGTEAAAD